MASNIITTAAPNLDHVGNPEFDLNLFEASLWNKGYSCILENALRCPCHAPDSPLLNCQNCFGTGYFYINPTKTKALITSINSNNKYSKWSQELLGTVQISVLDANKTNLSYYDRITIKDQYCFYSENLEIRNYDEESFIFTTYKPINIISIHLFYSYNQKLILLDPSSYTINPNNPYCITFLPDAVQGKLVASIYYKYETEYHVIDLPHDIRASWNTSKDTGAQTKIDLPIQAIARRSHLISSGKPNFDGSGVIINDNT